MPRSSSVMRIVAAVLFVGALAFVGVVTLSAPKQDQPAIVLAVAVALGFAALIAAVVVGVARR